MKSAITFTFHLTVALLAVPMLALVSGALLYRAFHRVAGSAQQFYSDHLFTLLAVTGLWLAYLVCDTFTEKYAMWVWIPALLLFTLRVLMWRSEVSVLGHESIVNHFFAADCAIQNWRQINFGSNCFDRLLFMQIVIAPIAYSAGAAIHHVVKQRLRPA